jgi:hypothetical protein
VCKLIGEVKIGGASLDDAARLDQEIQSKVQRLKILEKRRQYYYERLESGSGEF